MYLQTLRKRIGQSLVPAFGIIAACAMFSGTASAQLTTNKSVVTFDAPVEIPGVGAQVLPPGTYVFRLVDSKQDRNIVQVLNKDETHVYSTILAIPSFRQESTNKTVMTFAERAVGQPQAIRSWFYPGDRWGQEFVYPKSKAVELAKVTNLPIAYIPDEVVAQTAVVEPITSVTAPAVIVLRNVPVMAVKPTGEVVQVAEVFQAPPVQAERALPKTASNLPLVALMGLLCLVAGVSLRRPSCDR